MLSILIPVYQYDVRGLVRELHQQAQSLSVPWEIICLDDGSDEFWRLRNRELAGFSGVNYEEASQNMGRSRVRNALAQRARYPFLQFMDCDSGIVRPDFLQKYTRALQADTVLCGGCVYARERPVQRELVLHWLYGKAREEIPVDQRAQRPHHAFKTNNFVVPASVIRQFPFDDRLRRYGHEDTLFGHELALAGIPVQHLDNPLEHVGLEPIDVYLRKAEQALYNLAFLRQQESVIQTRMTVAYTRLQRWGLSQLAEWAWRPLQGLFQRNLRSQHPDLRIFDAWRLGIFLRAMHGKSPIFQ